MIIVLLIFGLIFLAIGIAGYIGYKSYNKDKQVDCVVSDWGTCSKTCGVGIQTRYVETPASNGGKCDFELQRFCNTKLCPPTTTPPRDCVLSDWSRCSRECGAGVETRNVISPATGGGNCGELSRPCKVRDCPVDCVLSDYVLTDDNCRTNPYGSRTFTQRVTSPAQYGGVCNPQTRTESCPAPPPVTTSTSSSTGSEDPIQPASVDCILSDWSVCSKTCGGGVRTRTVLSQAQYGGRSCDRTDIFPLSEPCNTDPCPDCVLTTDSSGNPVFELVADYCFPDNNGVLSGSRIYQQKILEDIKGRGGTCIPATYTDYSCPQLTSPAQITSTTEVLIDSFVFEQQNTNIRSSITFSKPAILTRLVIFSSGSWTSVGVVRISDSSTTLPYVSYTKPIGEEKSVLTFTDDLSVNRINLGFDIVPNITRIEVYGYV